MSFLIGVWGTMVTALFIAAYFSPGSATFERFGRFIYMIVLALALIGAVLGALRSRQSGDN